MTDETMTYDEAWLIHLASIKDAKAATKFVALVLSTPGRATAGFLSVVANMLEPQSAFPLRMDVTVRGRGRKPKAARNATLGEIVAAINRDRELLDVVMNDFNATGVNDASLKREVRRMAQEQRDNDERMRLLIQEERARRATED